MNTIEKSFRVAPVPKGVDDAVGMGKKQWFVAIVNHNTEKNAAVKLSKIGITNYIPIQSEYRIWNNGKKVKVDRVVIPSTLFVNCTEQERKEIVKFPFINRFMTNKAGITINNIHKPLAIIPDYQIETLKFMLGQSDISVEITERSFKSGDKVKVIRGSLAGLEGEIVGTNNDQSELIVSLELFGCARLFIDTINLEIIK